MMTTAIWSFEPRMSPYKVYFRVRCIIKPDRSYRRLEFALIVGSPFGESSSEVIVCAMNDGLSGVPGVLRRPVEWACAQPLDAGGGVSDRVATARRVRLAEGHLETVAVRVRFPLQLDLVSFFCVFR
jgi:hypothetical protein